MCKSPGIGATLDEHNRLSEEKMRRYKQGVSDLANATPEELRSRVAQLEEEVANLKLHLTLEEKAHLRSRLDVLRNPTIYSKMKAGCIGEFVVEVEAVCPECWNKGEDDEDVCSLCDNESDENGIYYYDVVVPWTTQKEIFKMMCKYKAQALEEEAERGDYE